MIFVVGRYTHYKPVKCLVFICFTISTARISNPFVVDLYGLRDRLGPVALVPIVGPVRLVFVAQRYVPDGAPGPAPPLIVVGLGLGQQLGTRQRDDDRSNRSGQHDGYDARHHDRPGEPDGLVGSAMRSDLQYGRTQHRLNAP